MTYFARDIIFGATALQAKLQMGEGGGGGFLARNRHSHGHVPPNHAVCIHGEGCP